MTSVEGAAGASVPRAELPDRADQSRRLKAALGLTAAVLVFEIVGGILSGSLALVADAVHMFTDVAALTLAWAGLALSGRAPTRRHTFGLARAEILAAFVNAQVLILAALYLLWEAWRRFSAPAPIQTGLMFGVAAAGLAANVAAIALLRGHRGRGLNMRAAYLEVVSDALGSVAVLLGAAVMRATRWYALDALLSAGIALLVLPRAVAILREAAHILLEGAPADVDTQTLRERILAVPGVEALHDMHCWTLTSGRHSASLHIRARGDVLVEVQRVLREEAGIEHATIQVESTAVADCSAESHA